MITIETTIELEGADIRSISEEIANDFNLNADKIYEKFIEKLGEGK